MKFMFYYMDIKSNFLKHFIFLILLQVHAIDLFAANTVTDVINRALNGVLDYLKQRVNLSVSVEYLLLGNENSNL